jgi:hypothetical protein
VFYGSRTQDATMTLALVLGSGGLATAAVLWTASRTREVKRRGRGEWQQTTVATLRDAEELLDALETRGYAERELIEIENSCIAVRWR